MPSSCALIRKKINFSSSGHRKPDALMFIFSLLSSVNLSDGRKLGGRIGRTGRERRGSEGIFRIMRYSSGRVVRTGHMRFATFLYRADMRALKVVCSSSDSSSELYF